MLGIRAARRDSTHRLVLSRIIARTVSALAGRRLRDSNTPFRLLRRELWLDLQPLIPRDARAPSIMVSLGAARRGWRVIEAPVTHLPRAQGSSTLRSLRLVVFQPRRAARADGLPRPASTGAGARETRSPRGGVTGPPREALAGASSGSVATRGRKRLRVAFGRYELVFGGVVLVALALRVADLTAKPFHHDESEHAWFTWLRRSARGTTTIPVFHGPVQFYVMSLLYLLIGAGDLAARLAPALVGTVVTALPYLLRRQLGRTLGRSRPRSPSASVPASCTSHGSSARTWLWPA